MTLTQMRYFQAVCKYENYTKAAEALYVSQPAISQAIRDLENECGIKLFFRRGNGLVLTDGGQVLLEEVNAVLRHMDSLERLISAEGLKRNFVRMGLSTLSSSTTFPKICAAYHKKYPEYQVVSHEGSTSELFELLDADRVDIIITSPNIRKVELAEKYNEYPLGISGLRYCVSVKHPWAGRKSVTLEEIAREPLILISEHYNSHRMIKKMFSEQNLEPNIIMVTSQMFTIERFVESGAAGGFLPPEIAVSNRQIVPLDYPDERPLRHTVMIWKPKVTQYPSVDKFIRVARELYPHVEQEFS